MTQNTEDAGKGTWLSQFNEGGGLPAFLGGQAGKAISRLIGAGVDIPAAWIEGYSQKYRDRNRGKSLVSDAISKAVAEKVVQDNAVIERAKVHLLGKEYRNQVNRESVAAEAVADLAEGSSIDHDRDISDDWMNKFERVAEDASSKELQFLFGKLLAGEIRKPGSISVYTLHMVSMMDAHIAKLAERAMSLTIRGDTVLLGKKRNNFSVVEQSDLEHAGFWSADKVITLSLEPNGFTIVKVRKESGVAIFKADAAEITFDTALLSKSGQDLLDIIQPKPDLKTLHDTITEYDVDKIVYGDLVIDGINASLTNLRDLASS